MEHEVLMRSTLTYNVTYIFEEQGDWSALIILTNMDENLKFSHMENLNLYGDNSIQMSVFCSIKLKNMYH